MAGVTRPTDLIVVDQTAYNLASTARKLLGLNGKSLEPGESKNYEGRMFPMTPELTGILARQLEGTRQLEKATERIIPWVFHRDSTPIKDYYDAWDKACRLAGVPDRLAHDLRRTAVRSLERAGVARSAAMKMTGHKTESIYRRYAIVDEAMLKESASKLAAFYAE